MERKLKERLVGAALLVLAAALVIPLFLDGPAPESTAERPTVALPPAADADARTRTVRLEQSRDTPTAPPQAEPPGEAQPAPGPVGETPAAAAPVDAEARAPVAATPVAEPVPAPVQPPPRPAATPAPSPAPSPAPTGPAPADPAPAPADTGSNWVVQLGSFGSRDNAERLAAELREKRHQSFVTRVDSDGRTLHRVRVGPAGTRDEADRLLQRLQADGYSGQPVPE
jgi:DedD protein